MDNNSNGKLAALLKREAALKEAIAAEKVRRQKREEKDDVKLDGIIGRVSRAESTHDAELKAHICAAMQKAELAEGERKLARAKGWL